MGSLHLLDHPDSPLGLSASSSVGHTAQPPDSPSPWSVGFCSPSLSPGVPGRHHGPTSGSLPQSEGAGCRAAPPCERPPALACWFLSLALKPRMRTQWAGAHVWPASWPGETLPALESPWLKHQGVQPPQTCPTSHLLLLLLLGTYHSISRSLYCKTVADFSCFWVCLTPDLKPGSCWWSPAQGSTHHP